MLLGAIAGAEMAMRDVGIEVELGSGVGAAQAHFRGAQRPRKTRSPPNRSAIERGASGENAGLA